MRLERSLVLNRYFDKLFGADNLQELKSRLQDLKEGPDSDGESFFCKTLLGLDRADDAIRGKLRDYDARIVSYEARLSKARSSFKFKYFQYLCLLYTEIFLDQLTANPDGFLLELNTFLGQLRREEASLKEFPDFTLEDLRRLAFFMATGSGKTLLLHTNLWQVLYYLEHGKDPQALVDRVDGRRRFDAIILITPYENLSQQHLDEFSRSGIGASLLTEDRGSAAGIFGPQVKVIEIHKLAEEPSKEGVSILLEELGDNNLVFVDEGHKGTGSEARTWKNRQRCLSARGFLLEYSATFAQSIGTASQKTRTALLFEYGKSILFDYSYRHFYDDGYGKDFRVLNLARAREKQAQELLVSGLLTYYQQFRLFQGKRKDYHPYNLERPLWVFLGSSVNAVYSKHGRKRSDVATVVSFLRRFLEEPAWAMEKIGKILKGNSGFTDKDTKQDLFAPILECINEDDPEKLYKRICQDLFHGQGALEVWEIKAAEGELALGVSAPEGSENPYFGLINIGDIPNFKKHLSERVGLEVREDRFTSSLFLDVQSPASSINVLVGAKKFIEGWSSWRVSAMGLLNIGKGEGPQVLQLFGRGVRLKGKNWTLKRSQTLPEEGPHPQGLKHLETLYIFGWNADYIQSFRAMLEQEEIPRELEIPVKTLFDPWPRLPVPRLDPSYQSEFETWTLYPEDLDISVDLTPKVTALTGAESLQGGFGSRKQVDFVDPAVFHLLDVEALYVDLLEYKRVRGYSNVFIPRHQIASILRNCRVYLSESDLADPELIQEGALTGLRKYLDRFMALKEREAESRHLGPAYLVRESVGSYTVRVSSEELLKEIQELLRKPVELYRDGDKPLPRLHIEEHLFTPLLRNPADYKLDGISVSPAGLNESEATFLVDLRNFWKTHHKKESYRELEIFVLRNLPKTGIGFFRKSGFYPDFLLWSRHKRSGAIRVQFIEPHGMRLSGGLAGNEEKIACLKELEKLTQEPPFRDQNISLSGYLLTGTDLRDIPDAKGKDPEVLEKQYRLLHQGGNYIPKLIRH